MKDESGSQNINNKMSLYTKLALARSEIDVKKNGKNTFSHYDYYKIDDIYYEAKRVFAKYEIATFNELQFIKEISMYRATLHVINGDSPEERFFQILDAPLNIIKNKEGKETLMECQKVGTNNTYMFKYLWMNLLMVDDGVDDPDSKKSEDAKTYKQQMDGIKDRKSYLDNKVALENCVNLDELISVWDNMVGKEPLIDIKNKLKHKFEDELRIGSEYPMETKK